MKADAGSVTGVRDGCSGIMKSVFPASSPGVKGQRIATRVRKVDAARSLAKVENMLNTICRSRNRWGTALTALATCAALMPVLTEAKTVMVGPTDCSASAVNAAISGASTGDTVSLTCSGTQTWTATVTIPSNKGITLQVEGGTNTPKASANFPLTIVGSSGITIVKMLIGPNNPVSRVTGFKFRNSGTSNPAIQIDGQGTGTDSLGSFRFDNNYLDGLSGEVIVGVWARQGPLFGLIDNNTLLNVYRASDPAYGPYAVQVWNWWHPAGTNQCWGCDGWTSGDFAYGTARTVFIEDNLFKQTSAAAGHMRHYISSELGARYVSRYNEFQNNYGDRNADLHDAHGLCLVNSNGAGARGGEIYGNTISGGDYYRAMQLRGGSWLVYDNTITPGAGNPIEFDEYRAKTPSQCSTSNNLAPVMPPWPVPPGATWSATAPWVATVSDASRYPLPQQIFNTYVWNNRNASTGALINPAAGSSLEGAYIQNNRDYFASTSKPAALGSYAAYQYPHPLRAALSPPTNLRVTGTTQ